jgi:hypothetical protein
MKDKESLSHKQLHANQESKFFSYILIDRYKIIERIYAIIQLAFQS